MTERLWAITSYFNPANSVRRLSNFKTFRRDLEVPLIAVELSFGAPFQLSDDDADILIQVDVGDVMFQKERLLNLGLQQIPNDVDHVAWIDCDLVLNSGWSTKAIKALSKHPIVQLFSKFYDVPRDTPPADFQPIGRPNESLGVHLARGAEPASIREAKPGRLSGGYLFGLAWAGRVEILRSGLYDGCIVGNGDRAMVAAALGQFSCMRNYQLMNSPRYEHYLDWARGFHQLVQGNIGYVDTTIFHLWHGDLSNRQYKSRLEHFAKFDFNPYEDISTSPKQAWKWSSEKPEMHAFLRDYFARRHEDGGTVAAEKV